jgi:hypothetical protein
MRSRFSGIGFVGVLLVLFANCLCGQVEYSPSLKTYVLMHLNDKDDLKIVGQGEKASAKLFGDAAIIDKGWYKGALNPGKDGGILVQTDRPFNPDYGHATLEAWVYLNNYPAKRGYIIDKIYECANTKVHNNKPEKGAVGISLFVDSQGRIGNEITSLYYGPGHKRTFYSPDGFKIPLKEWVHVVLSDAPWPVGKYRIYINKKPILSKICAYHHKIFYVSEKEEACGKIVIGNNAAHDGVFPGLIDEVRVLGGNVAFGGVEDMSWNDPQSKRPLKRGAPCFLPDTKERIYVSCDEIDKYQAEEMMRFYPVFSKGGKLVPGVRGNAWSGNLDLKGKGIIDGKKGSLEFWMRPDNWNNRSTRNLGVAGFGPKPWVNIYIFNSVHELRPLTLYFQNDEGKNTFLGFGKTPMNQNIWYHVVLTWDGPSYKTYINGKIASDNEFRGIDKMINAVREYVNFKGEPVPKGENKGKTTSFDEIYVYGTALNPIEVKNAYYRYLAPEKVVKAVPYDVNFKNYPSLEKIIVDVDFLKDEKPATLKLNVTQNGKELASETLKVDSGKKTVSFSCPMGKVNAGAFKANLDFIGADGKVLDTMSHEFKKLETPWLHNKLGVPVKVPEPWIPLEKVGDYKLKSLMSEYDFSKGLLGQVVTNSDKTLAAPVMFQGKAGGKKLEFSDKTELTVNKKGLEATVKKEFTSSQLTIDAKGLIDFDGFIKYQIELKPTGDSVELDSLVLRIPCKSDQALDYYVLGEHMDHMSGEVPEKKGTFWKSLDGGLFKRHEIAEYGAMGRPRKSMVYGNFYGYAWLGNNHRGLCYMADNDAGWVQNDKKSALALTRNGDKVYMTLNLVAEPVKISKDKPRKITLALMATPSKRPAKGWRHWRTDSFYPTEESGRAKDDSIFYVPYPVDYKASKKFMDKVWKKGHIPLPYMDFYGSDGRMGPAEYFRWEWWPGIAHEDFPKKASIYRSNYCSGSLIDWYIYNLNKWVDQCGVNGLYVDNHFPCPLAYPVVGPGYVHEKGKVQPGYELFAMREFFKRIYCLLEAKGKKHPYLMVHMTHSMMAPTLSFADIAYEGEDHYLNGERDGKATGREKNLKPGEVPDHITFWPNHVVRVIDEPHTWGVASYWLTAVRGAENNWKLKRSRDEYIRAWYTQLLLHDMRGGARPDKGMMDVFKRFLDNDPDVKFTLYRDNKAIVANETKDVYISYYQKKGKEVLVVLGNHQEKPVKLTVTIKPDLLGLGSFNCFDAESLKKLKIIDNQFKATVKPRDYRLILLKGE